MRKGIGLLERRVAELRAFDVGAIDDGEHPQLTALSQSIAATLATIYGVGSHDYVQLSRARRLDRTNYLMATDWSGGTSVLEVREGVARGVAQAIAILQQAADSLKEKLGDEGEPQSAEARILRAYQGLDLHPQIADAASELYQDGHYANAIEDAVKALNDLVRLKSGLAEDGSRLMQRAFGGDDPLLRFNDLADQSDRDEQLRGGS
jgi:hypothetical protein